MEHIGGILAKNQQGRSQTLSSERICSDCGEKPAKLPYLRCVDCLKKEADAQHERQRQEAEKQLQETIEEQESEWQVNKSNLPGKFLNKTFENFDSSLQPKAFKAVKNLQWTWIDDDDDEPPKSLILLSPGIYGVGKTHLVCALVNRIITTTEKAYLDKFLQVQSHRCPVHIVSENELLRRIRDTYNRDAYKQETEEQVYESLKRFSLLIIDDAGKVRPRDLNFLQSVYFNIIDQRYNDEQSIVLTTNLNLAELEEHIGGACADRLVEMAGKAGIIKMAGKSYRLRDK